MKSSGVIVMVVMVLTAEVAVAGRGGRNIMVTGVVDSGSNNKSADLKR